MLRRGLVEGVDGGPIKDSQRAAPPFAVTGATVTERSITGTKPH
jgi:hypothetical protein